MTQEWGTAFNLMVLDNILELWDVAGLDPLESIEVSPRSFALIEHLVGAHVTLRTNLNQLSYAGITIHKKRT